MGGSKIHSIFSGLLPSSILAPYMLTLSALHSFSQTLQPPGITHHSTPKHISRSDEEIRNKKINISQEKDLEKLHLRVFERKTQLGRCWKGQT